MKKILSLFFVFLLIVCSVYSIPRVKSSSLEEEKAYYRSLIENPPADIESYEFTDYDIEMILEAKEYLRTKLYLQQLEAKRERYISKKGGSWIPPAKNNPVKHHIPSKEEIESFEKSRQENQRRLEELDKRITLLREWLEENK